MALDLPLPSTSLPAHAEGTIDGLVPVRFEDHGESWSLRIGGDFHYQETHDLPPCRRTGQGLLNGIYLAVARYREAGRGPGLLAQA